MIPEIKKKMTEKMDKSMEHLHTALAGIRTGRASLSLLDGIMVDYYGTPTPLRQAASLSIPESRLITIQPWEVRLIGDIEKAVLAANIGLTPANDGKIIRLPFPPLTEERRKELVKMAHKTGEDTKVSMRNIRRDANDELKKLHKESKITDDEFKKAQDDIQKVTDQHIQRIDEALTRREKEILEV